MLRPKRYLSQIWEMSSISATADVVSSSGRADSPPSNLDWIPATADNTEQIQRDLRTRRAEIESGLECYMDIQGWEVDSLRALAAGYKDGTLAAHYGRWIVVYDGEVMDHSFTSLREAIDCCADYGVMEQVKFEHVGCSRTYASTISACKSLSLPTSPGIYGSDSVVQAVCHVGRHLLLHIPLWHTNRYFISLYGIRIGILIPFFILIGCSAISSSVSSRCTELLNHHLRLRQKFVCPWQFLTVAPQSCCCQPSIRLP